MLCLSAEFANKAGQKVQGQDGNTETAQISQYTVLLDLWNKMAVMHIHDYDKQVT